MREAGVNKGGSGMRVRALAGRTTLTAILSLLGACDATTSDGSSSSSSGSNNDASVAGIWTGSDSTSSLSVTGIVTADGEFHFIRGDNVQYVGNASVDGTSVSANFDVYTQFGDTFSGGSSHGTGKLSNGTVSERSSLKFDTSFKTDSGKSSSGSVSLSFSTLYDVHSSLTTISGNFENTDRGDVVSLTTDGVLSWDNADTGCQGTGSVSVIDTNHDIYRIQFQYANCTGDSADLNGVAFTGLALLNTNVSPQQVVLAVNGSTANGTYGLVIGLNRT